MTETVTRTVMYGSRLAAVDMPATAQHAVLDGPSFTTHCHHCQKPLHGGFAARDVAPNRRAWADPTSTPYIWTCEAHRNGPLPDPDWYYWALDDPADD